MTDRTNSDRVADKHRKRAFRKQQTGRAGRQSKKQVVKQDAIIKKYGDHPFDMFTEKDVPELSDPQRRMLCLWCDPEVRENLTNLQIGEIVGLSGQEVGMVRTSKKFLDAVFRLYMPILESMMPDVLTSLHKAIKEGDNTARSQFFKLLGMIKDRPDTTFKVTVEQLNLNVHDSLASLMPKPGDTVESNLVDAEYSVE